MTSEIITQRPLSIFENFFRCRTVNRYYKGFQVTAKYSRPISIATLYSALRQLVLEYHVLVCNVFPDGSEYIMKPIDKVNLQDVLILQSDPKYLTNGVINELAMKYLNTFQFDLYCQKPLFKLVLFDAYTLSVVFDHTLFDGLVGNYFHELLLQKLANDHGDIDEQIAMKSPVFDYANDLHLIKHSLPPPIDDYAPDWDIDYSNNDPNYFDKIVPPGLCKFPGRFPNTTDYSLAFKLINFSSEELSRILNACKAHKVTLTSYIMIVYLVSFESVFGNHYTINKTAITLRRYYNKASAPHHYKHFFDVADYKLMGNLPHMGLAYNCPPLKQFSWDTVRDFNSGLLSSVDNKYLLNTMKGFKDIYPDGKDNRDFFDSKLGQEKSESTKLSNLGFIKVPEIKSWTINDMIFSQDVSAITSDFMINCISTPVGGLNVVVSYLDHCFEDTDMDNFDGLVERFRTNVLTQLDTKDH